MSKIEKTLSKIDDKIDKKFSFFGGGFKRYFPVLSSLFFALIVVVFVFRVFYARPRIIASVIADDIKIISLALEKIDAKCNILNVEDDISDIDFLNIEKFSGSQVGPINLAYPKKWEGPYLRVNPTVQGKFYELVRAKDGLFIVPGNGVHLPNGFIVGKDFSITPETYVRPLFDKGALHDKGIKLGKQIEFKVGDWDPWLLKEKKIKEVDRLMKEFHEAVPFTKNSNKSLSATGELNPLPV